MLRTVAWSAGRRAKTDTAAKVSEDNALMGQSPTVEWSMLQPKSSSPLRKCAGRAFLGRDKPGKRSVNVRDWNAVSKRLSEESGEDG